MLFKATYSDDGPQVVVLEFACNSWEAALLYALMVEELATAADPTSPSMLVSLIRIK